ncbi:uncharacterized protein PSFLO_07401 [Pseudozyma flocculosa]|uniref:Uncharacterized protein n=1 Tax=Pseudozyma flocculosa TaxID=84751 RepID=A0A5C3FC36_9BASI|nr:uncharacterized protein PSFLO_07401 [Pseudozyma flocculosa]
MPLVSPLEPYGNFGSPFRITGGLVRAPFHRAPPRSAQAKLSGATTDESAGRCLGPVRSQNGTLWPEHRASSVLARQAATRAGSFYDGRAGVEPLSADAALQRRAAAAAAHQPDRPPTQACFPSLAAHLVRPGQACPAAKQIDPLLVGALPPVLDPGLQTPGPTQYPTASHRPAILTRGSASTSMPWHHRPPWQGACLPTYKEQRSAVAVAFAVAVTALCPCLAIASSP